MTDVNDRLWIWVNIKKKHVLNSINMEPVFNLLDSAIEIAPTFIERSDLPTINIKHFYNPIVLEAVDKYKDTIRIADAEENVIMTIMQEAGGNRSGFSLYIQSQIVEKIEPIKIKTFFTTLMQMLPFDYAQCHFDKNGKDLHDNEYEKIGDRTFFASGLFWLNFFGPSEEAKQGGKALETNPHATEIKRLENGLFIQVGESPFDCYTEKGRERLINATKAMPPATW